MRDPIERRFVSFWPAAFGSVAAMCLAMALAACGSSAPPEGPQASSTALASGEPAPGHDAGKVSLDFEAMRAQGAAPVEVVVLGAAGKAQERRVRLVRGTKLVAMIDNACADGRASGLSRQARDPNRRHADLKKQAYEFRLDRDVDLEELIASADADDCVAQVANDVEYRIDAAPNDPLFASQWHHSAIESSAAYDAFYAASGGISRDVTVAVVDTGVDFSHPDLQAALWTDSDGSHGYDFVNADSDPTDDQGHGTHCAGLVAAVMNNSQGVAGVMGARAKIMAVKSLSSSGSGSSAVIANGILFAAQKGARVISLSFGGPGTSSVMRDAIRSAVQSGATVAMAAGNNNALLSSTTLYSPASYGASIAGAITVGAFDRTLAKASYSNYGPAYVEIGSPGSSILSTLRGGSYGTMSGTSMATPIVAGSAALVVGLLSSRGVDPAPALVESLLEEAAVKDGALAGAFRDGNRLNIRSVASLINARYPAGSGSGAPSPTPAPPPSSPSPTPAPTPSAGGPAIERFVLFDPSTGREIREIRDGGTIDLSVDGASLNVIAYANGSTLSVKFEFAGRSPRIDSLAPFTLIAPGNAYAFAAGNSYEFAATPYSLKSATGTAGAAARLSVSVIQSGSVPTPTPTPAPTPGPLDPACGSMTGAACDVFKAINVERRNAGLAALKPLSNCILLEQSHVDDMAKNGFFSHTSPTNGTFSDRVRRFGLSGYAGENIAMGYLTVASVVIGWMNSSGHRANILNANYKSTGVGVARSATGTTYFGQCFSSVAGE